jgi:hypothetical protein
VSLKIGWNPNSFFFITSFIWRNKPDVLEMGFVVEGRALPYDFGWKRLKPNVQREVLLFGQVVERLRREPLNNRELDKLVAELGNSRTLWRRSLDLFNWLKRHNYMFDNRLLTTFIRVLQKNKAHKESLDIYDYMKESSSSIPGRTPTVFTYTAAMRSALDYGNVDKAYEVSCRLARCAYMLLWPECVRFFMLVIVSTCCMDLHVVQTRE